MKREQVLRVGILLWLMVVWILLWGNISFGNIFGGLAVGLIIMVLLPLPRVPVEGRVHLLSILRLLWMIVYYAIQSSIQVAWLAIRPSPPPVTGVLRYQLGSSPTWFSRCASTFST